MFNLPINDLDEGADASSAAVLMAQGWEEWLPPQRAAEGAQQAGQMGRGEATEIQQALHFCDQKDNAEMQKQLFITPLAVYWTQQKLQLLKTHFQNTNNSSIQNWFQCLWKYEEATHTQINQSNTQFQGENCMKNKQLSESKQQGTTKKLFMIERLLKDTVIVKLMVSA